MAFRSDLEAAHARNAVLERKLAESEATRRALAMPPEPSEEVALDSTSNTLFYHRTIDGALDEAALKRVSRIAFGCAGPFVDDKYRLVTKSRKVVEHGLVFGCGTTHLGWAEVKIVSSDGVTYVSLFVELKSLVAGGAFHGGLSGLAALVGGAAFFAAVGLSGFLGLLVAPPTAWLAYRRRVGNAKEKSCGRVKANFDRIADRIERELSDSISE